MPPLASKNEIIYSYIGDVLVISLLYLDNQPLCTSRVRHKINF